MNAPSLAVGILMPDRRTVIASLVIAAIAIGILLSMDRPPPVVEHGSNYE